MILVNTTVYERINGKPPSGVGHWSFMLQTDRVTEKDHYFTTKRMNYPRALAEAQALAERRRSSRIVVMPY